MRTNGIEAGKQDWVEVQDCCRTYLAMLAHVCLLLLLLSCGKVSHISIAWSLQEAAEMVGRKIAELCLQNQIQQVCFDRGGNIYHGRVQVHEAVISQPCVPSACPVCLAPLTE